MITVSKAEAVVLIQRWADEAEDSNYHGLAGALGQLATEVARYQHRGDLGFHVWTVKAIDGFLTDENIAHIYVRQT